MTRQDVQQPIVFHACDDPKGIAQELHMSSQIVPSDIVFIVVDHSNA
ncbi:hypothetical protein [Bifidobacterium aquikefiri]